MIVRRLGAVLVALGVGAACAPTTPPGYHLGVRTVLPSSLVVVGNDTQPPITIARQAPDDSLPAALSRRRGPLQYRAMVLTQDSADVASSVVLDLAFEIGDALISARRRVYFNADGQVLSVAGDGTASMFATHRSQGPLRVIGDSSSRR